MKAAQIHVIQFSVEIRKLSWLSETVGDQSWTFIPICSVMWCAATNEFRQHCSCDASAWFRLSRNTSLQISLIDNNDSANHLSQYWSQISLCSILHLVYLFCGKINVFFFLYSVCIYIFLHHSLTDHLCGRLKVAYSNLFKKIPHNKYPTGYLIKATAKMVIIWNIITISENLLLFEYI